MLYSSSIVFWNINWLIELSSVLFGSCFNSFIIARYEDFFDAILFSARTKTKELPYEYLVNSFFCSSVKSIEIWFFVRYSLMCLSALRSWTKNRYKSPKYRTAEVLQWSQKTQEVIGMARAESITFKEFRTRFSTEESCRAELFRLRFPNGFVCPKCGCTEYYPVRGRNTFQCRACRHQTSVTAGTVMHRTHLPLTVWFWAIYLCATDKRGISAVQLSRTLGICYESA